jgi:hypothetical protein
MDCGQIQKLFTAYRDQELKHQNLLSFEKHLTTCPHCTKDWNDFQEILRRLQAVATLPAPPDLLPSIHEKIDRSHFGQKLARIFQKIFAPVPLTAAASTMGAILLLAVYFDLGSAPGIDLQTISAEQMDTSQIRNTFMPQLPTRPAALTDPGLHGRSPAEGFHRPPAVQPSAIPSFLSNPPAGTEDSAHLFYQYLIERDQADLARAYPWQYSLDSADRSLFIPELHKIQIGAPLTPDITILIRHLSPAGLDHLHRQIQEEGNWQTRRYHHNHFLVLVNPEDLSSLYGLLQRHRLPFSAHGDGIRKGERSAHEPLLIAIRP